jgi:diadenosine tetraphosphate (Ap4A) HIT family hydrolase
MRDCFAVSEELLIFAANLPATETDTPATDGLTNGQIINFQNNIIMYSDPKECLYCTNNETLHNLMIEFATLRVSRAFLFKEQTYRGRCLVAYNGHVNDLNELSDEERNDFMADVAQVTRAMQKAFNPEKINYGAYSDKLSHLHFHLAPKYVDGPDYGGTFQMNPGKVYLTDAEYQEMIEKIKAVL